MPQPHITTANGKRQFATFPVALLAYIINEREEFLLLAHPDRKGWWEVVNGGLDAGETVLDGALREVAEEAGPEVRVRPLGIVHVFNFHFDKSVRYMLSIGYLMAYEGGSIQPGDDMHGSQFKWWTLDELMADDAKIIVPPNRRDLFQRARDLYRLWKDQDMVLQPELRFDDRNKYDL